MLLVDPSSVFSLQLFEGYLLVMSLLGAGAMGVDKLAARLQSERISERTLFYIAIFGGFIGITFGGIVFRHKTLKGYFWIPVAAGWMIWIVIAVVYFFPWLLTF
jgi:uncharacterized membrane protein YsdA (DUF1294 family)